MDELSELIWKDFKFKHKNFPEPHLERYNEQRFKREFTVYKIGHFATRIVELTDKFELPFNSILHVLDNVNQPVYQDTPRIEENEFIQRESGRKFIYHITELNTKGPIIYPDKYILRFAGLPTKLMKFRQEQKNNFRYLNSIDEFPTNPMYLTVVNHNPLFRMRMFGRLQFFRTTQQILASIFNTCTEMTKLNKHQFVLIPWSDEVFDKQMFVRSRTELSFTTVKRPESFHYIFMMHLVNYMFDKDTTSMFEKLDETTLSQVTLILKHNDKYLFLNLKDIKDLNVKNVAYFRFINQLNLLALLGNKQIDMSHPEVTKLIEENTTELGTEYSIKGTTTVTDTDTNFKLEPEVTQVTDEHTESIISKIVNTVLPKKTIVPVVGANSHTTIPEQKEIIRTIEPSGKQTAKRVAIVDRTNNISKIKSTNLNSDTYAEEYIRDLDKATEEFIDNNEDLTPAAKNHFKKLATKYKTCMVSGVPIDKLLRDHSDISLTEDKIDKKVMGYIPDESMLNSSTATFEKDYVRKTFNKHLAGVITSFQKNGVFLVNVEQKVVADPLNNYTIYTCTYEDIHSKRSTVKFKMPNIDANDRFVTDGNKQVIKKQRCVLPIVKINEREVSLASNYNKTRVVRNETKAHSYSGYIDKILDKDKSTAKLVYGNLSINESISYEYCVMASKFMSIEFQHGKKHYYLVFNYHHRLASFGESAEKLDKLESLYGIYFGHTEDEYLFVDNANSVFSVYKKGGENVDFEATTIVDVLKLSLKPGVNEPKPLSEYVTIKILNAELPVVFMLAYKYGLRNILEYLGAKYTITENRSKTIIGENVATESFGVNSDRVAGADDLEIIYGKDWIKPNNDSKPSITIINRRPEQDETDVTVDQSREHDPIYSIGTEAIDRPVKPRLGKIQFFISVNKSNDELNPYTVKIRGMLIEVKLGLSNTVPRRVTNYDGLTFKTTDPKKLSKQLVEKAADYLHCGERKISMASVNVINADAPTPPAVAKAKQMSTEEYAKLTSKLVNDDTRVGGNESFEVIPNSSPSMGIIEKIIDSIIHVSRRLHEGKVFYYVTVKLVSLKTKTIGINHAYVYKFEKGHKRTVGAVNELFPRKWDAKSKEDIQRILDEITDICKQSKFGDHEVVLGGDTAKIIYQLGKRFDEEEKAGNESFEISMEDLSENVKYDPQPHDIHIRFADRVLHFNRYPLKYSLILSGLAAYDLSGYAMSEFESKDVYYDLFINNGLAANYLKGIDSFYDLFIDNMTYTVLKQMHEPTNVRDLLIRCSELLSSVDHKEASSAANHRIRGYEQFNAILYNEMSREFAGYQARRGKANTFSINANAVYLRIIQNESTMPAEAANPMEDIKIYSNITYGGIGGRTGESFVTVDRRYSADDVGVLSEATADSGKVGMNAMLSFDPTIKNTMGVIETKDPKELKPSNIISASAALMPYAVQDDCNRLNFISIQYSHVMNTECVDRNRIRTGYERVIAHRVSDNFAATAEQDGKVTKIDNVAKLMEVTYKDGTKTVFKIGDHYELAESIVIQNNIKPNFKEGDTFKKDDVLTYNEGYFNRDYFTGQVDMSTGVMANLCLLETDTTLEDATEISESLSKKLAINPVNERVVTMSAKSQIFTMAKIGDHVKVTDPLCIFDEEPLTQDPGLTEDEDALAILGDISKSAPTAKFSGEIVHIAVYCGCEVSEMSPSVANVVKAAYVETAAQAKLAKDTARANEFVKPTIVPKGSRFKGIEFDEDTVMIIFYIKERIVHGVGDKLVLCNQLKSTVAAVFPKPVTTESGIPIDVLYSQKGVNSRKVLSPFLTGILSRLVEKVEKDVVDEYFK